MLATKGMRFPIDIILVCIRWYAAYPLSYRHLEEMMEERGVFVDHSSINRWAIRFLPLLEKVFRKHKLTVSGSWRMDETYIKVKGVWKYLYRAVDKEGKTVDYLLTARRDKAAALRFFEKAMKASGAPEKVTMDKSGANKAAMDDINGRRYTGHRQASQVPEQYRGAGPSGHQAGHQANAQLQVISGRQKCPGRH
jgi:transposase-like protein